MNETRQSLQNRISRLRKIATATELLVILIDTPWDAWDEEDVFYDPEVREIMIGILERKINRLTKG